MTDLLDASIAALRTNHDQLEALVERLSREDLTSRAARRSGRWPTCSRTSAAARSSLARLAPAMAGVAIPEIDNQAVWDRWNAMSPEDQAAGFLEHHDALVALLECLDAEQRKTTTVDLGFCPPRARWRPSSACA